MREVEDGNEGEDGGEGEGGNEGEDGKEDEDGNEGEDRKKGVKTRMMVGQVDVTSGKAGSGNNEAWEELIGNEGDSTY